MAYAARMKKLGPSNTKEKVLLTSGIVYGTVSGATSSFLLNPRDRADKARRMKKINARAAAAAAPGTITGFMVWKVKMSDV